MLQQSMLPFFCIFSHSVCSPAGLGELVVVGHGSIDIGAADVDGTAAMHAH